MKKKFLSVLKALKLFDPDDTLSLSNVAMLVVLYKLATASSLDWTILSSFFLILLNHNARKLYRYKDKVKEVGDQERLSALEQAVQSVKTMLSLRK